MRYKAISNNTIIESEEVAKHSAAYCVVDFGEARVDLEVLNVSHK